MIGSALLAELAAEGERPRAAYHSSAKAIAAKRAGADAVVIDFGASETLPPALDGIETLFLLGGTEPDQADHEITVVREAAAADVTRIVKLSVWRAPEQLSPFATLHRKVEMEIEATGLDWTFLRPNSFMQNFTTRLGESIRTRKMFAQPRMEAASYIDTRDIARVAAKVLTEDGHAHRAYALSGPEALTLAEVARVLTGVLGHEIAYVEMSDDEASATMLAAGLPAFLVGYLIAVSRAYRTGGLEAVTASVETITGRPPTTFQQFVEDHRSQLL